MCWFVKVCKPAINKKKGIKNEAIPNCWYIKNCPVDAPIFPNKLWAIISLLESNSNGFSCNKSKSFFQLNKKEQKDKKSKLAKHSNKSPKTTCVVLFSMFISLGYLLIFFFAIVIISVTLNLVKMHFRIYTEISFYSRGYSHFNDSIF